MFKLINLVLLLAIVFFFTRKKIRAYFQSQKEELEQTMRSAAAEFEKVEAAHQEIKKKLEALDENIIELRKDSEKEIKREILKLEADTDRFVEKLEKDSVLRVEQEINNVRREFEAELVHEAVSQARATLGRKLEKQDTEWTTQIISSEKDSGGTENYAS